MSIVAKRAKERQTHPMQRVVARNAG